MKKFVLTLLLAPLLCSAPATAAETLSRGEVETIIKEYLDKNPEVIVDAVRKYQEKMRAEEMEKSRKAVSERGKELREDTDSPFAGSANGDVVLVEFFDYHCGYCKKMVPAITQLLKEDTKLKVVFKEFPILSKDSEDASRAALAVFRLKPEKYFEYHTALMNAKGKFDEKFLIEEAKKLGIDAAKLASEMKSPAVKKELTANRELAEAIGIRGTPAFIVGNDFIPGAASPEDLKQAIADVRKGGKK